MVVLVLIMMVVVIIMTDWDGEEYGIEGDGSLGGEGVDESGLMLKCF
ncbi:unnamed protein product [Anisakis simplex]|uniref:Uncharacterized protein n=1 Tax=Anisakis simplex TaxID=6269 RepID=A0A0M3JQB6_ANISI|nr:unnamed protein product [Anisakis simplex]